MKNQPLVSIVTPSYNQGKFIEDNILSVKNQDYPNIEHIIVDGGSTDNTLEILKKYEGKYNLRWVSEPDEGQSNALNKGFKMAGGEIIGWLNSDDFYMKNILDEVVKEFERDRELDMLYGDCNKVDSRGNPVYRGKASPFNLEKLITGCNSYIAQPSAFFRKRVFDKVGYINENLNYAMDHDFFIRIGINGKVKKVNTTLSNFRKHESAKTTKDILDMKKESYELGKQYGYNKDIMLHLNYMKFYLIYAYPPLTNVIRRIWLKIKGRDAPNSGR